MKNISSDDIFASEKQKRSSQNRIWHKIASMLIFALQFAIKNMTFSIFSPWEEALISSFLSRGD